MSPSEPTSRESDKRADAPKTISGVHGGSAVMLTILLVILIAAGIMAPGPGKTSTDVDALVSVSTIPRAPSADALATEPAVENGNTTKQRTVDEVLDIARQVLSHLRSDIRDYRGTLLKRERIGGRLGEETKMEFKIRNPKSSKSESHGLAAYLKFVSPASVAGREVIWGEQINNGKLISHEAGYKRLLGRMELEPDGTLAMLGQKYPITEIGMIRLVEKLIEKGEDEKQLAEATVFVQDNVRVGDRDCQMIQVTNANKKPNLDFHIAQIFIDSERQIPLRYAAYMWPTEASQAPPLEEEYTYLDVELNVGLTNSDFDANNSEYDYP